jgi:hypothetical protein
MGFVCTMLAAVGGTYWLYTESDLSVGTVELGQSERTTGAIQASLGPNWSVTRRRDTIAVRKDTTVDVIFTVCLPPMTRDGYKEYCRKQNVEIVARFAPRMSAEEYERLALENRTTARAIEDFKQNRLKDVRQTKPQDMDDLSSYYAPETDDEKARIGEFRTLLKTLPKHTLPNFYTDECSVYMTTSLRDGFAVFHVEDAAAYAKTWVTIAAQFRPYSDTAQPFWAFE